MFPPERGRARTVNLILEVSSPGDTILCHRHSCCHLYCISAPISEAALHPTCSPMVCILAQCVNGVGEPLAMQPWGFLPSKDLPVLLALLASSLIGPRRGEQLRLNGHLLGGCMTVGVHGPIWSICCLPGLNEATAAAAEACGMFLEATSKQPLNFAKQPPKSNWLCTGAILDRSCHKQKPKGSERTGQKESRKCVIV